MIINPQIPLHRLILSLSQMLDYVHPHVVDHQQRTAYIALRIGQKLGLRENELMDLFFASALHDIGIIGVENRISGIATGYFEDINWHAETGFELLRKVYFFSRAANIVRFHHIAWANGAGVEQKGMEVPYLSHILSCADILERLISRDVHVLDQVETITEKILSLEGDQLHPDCVEAFRQLADREDFWLDCVSERIYSMILGRMSWPETTLDEGAIEPIAEIFANIVDATSEWTATHSAGVASAAVELSDRLYFSNREKYLMKSAGYLHDIGKLTIPRRILDKPGKLDAHERNVLNTHTYYTFHALNTIGGMPQISEWAAFHHERLDGKGYPFHHSGEDLTLGSRIMAVADVFGALTEERPYHKSMSREKVLSIINKLVDNGGLDGDIASVLEGDYEAIYDKAVNDRNEYEKRQEILLTKLKTGPMEKMYLF